MVKSQAERLAEMPFHPTDHCTVCDDPKPWGGACRRCIQGPCDRCGKVLKGDDAVLGRCSYCEQAVIAEVAAHDFLPLEQRDR